MKDIRKFLNFTDKEFYLWAIWEQKVKNEVKLSLCLTDYALRREDLWGSGFVAPCFLHLGTSWVWMVQIRRLSSKRLHEGHS
jgi:hypothetical protein